MMSAESSVVSLVVFVVSTFVFVGDSIHQPHRIRVRS